MTLEPPAAVTADLVSLVEIARQRRPERAALLKRVESATDRGRAAAAGKRPTVGVAGGFDYAQPNPRLFPRSAVWAESWDVGINVNWPLFDGGRTRAEVAEASASARAAQARVAEFDSRAGRRAAAARQRDRIRPRRRSPPPTMPSARRRRRAAWPANGSPPASRRARTSSMRRSRCCRRRSIGRRRWRTRASPRHAWPVPSGAEAT